VQTKTLRHLKNGGDAMSFRFCSLASGSSGNCQYIETEKARVLLDAGLSGKKIQDLLSSIEVKPDSLNGILVTHEHQDHIKGVGILSRRFDIPIYANEETWTGMKDSIGKIDEKNMKLIKNSNGFEINDLGINPFSISHDARDPLGYSFYSKEKKLSVLTDTGVADESIRMNLKGSDFLMVESNHDPNMLKIGRYPQFLKQRVLGKLGHLSNEDAGRLIRNLDLNEDARVILGHISMENNFPELAYQTVHNVLSEAGMESLSIDMTYRDRPTRVYDI
jgi:phosphoribosyl 1,2-cyclic phosphodiesterase